MSNRTVKFEFESASYCFMPGDDIRLIDWRVFGKVDGKPAVGRAMQTTDESLDHGSGEQIQAIDPGQNARIDEPRAGP